MKQPSATAAARGFTLIEVLVALVIVAFAVGALMSSLTSAASYAGRQRDTSMAQWIGFNQISTVRLNLQQPANSTTTGELDYGPAHWAWEQTTEDIEIPGVKRITVKVKRTGELGSTGGREAQTPWITSVTGFKGDALNASAAGQSVNWNGGQELSGGGDQTGSPRASSFGNPTGNAPVRVQPPVTP